MAPADLRAAPHRRRNRWRDVPIGRAGRPLADALAPAIERWLDEHYKPGMFPGDLAGIALDVVKAIAEERGYYEEYNSHDRAR